MDSNRSPTNPSVEDRGLTQAELLARQLHAALASAGQTVAVAESLTAGLLGATLADAPGASRTFRGGVIAYATEVKSSVLGVERELLASKGAVHRDVAAQMAQGVRRLMDASYGLATTGVAGPEPQDGQEIGTLFVAVCGPTGTVVDEPHTDGVDVGEAIRQAAVVAALELLRDYLRPPE